MNNLENTIKQIDDWVLKTKGQPSGSDLDDLREILIKFQDQAKQEERDKFKDIIMRVLDEGLLTMERELNKELTEEDEDER
jgi:hypothetical protein